MAISLIGKIVITVVTLGVIAGMTAMIVTLVREEDHQDTTTTTTTTTTTEPVYEDTLYEVGVGIADMTGPCVEIVFMGYAEIGQTGRGLHTRQYSRAFIFVQGDTRVVLVTADVQAVGIHVRRQVVRNLQELYGDIYTLKNVILAGTHTHSGPGGHLVNFLLDVSIRGFSQQTFNAYVDGITRSIVRAHDNIVPARLYYGQTTVTNAQKNRSPFSYDFNPAEERMRYTDNLDHELTQLRIVKQNGDLHGVLNWFALHTTSMNMTNRLVSADNLGYAATRMEKTLNPDSPVGKPEVVAGFFTANLGDVSPNLEDAQCEFSGEYCDHHFHLCAAGERCYAMGPGEDMFESTRIIGTRVFEGALQVLNSPGEELTGNIAVQHQFIEVPEEVVARYDPVTRTFDQEDQVRGCSPAMGYSFASGTTDGANTLNITQGTLEGDDGFWDFVGGLVAAPTPDDEECHAPKPILLATGRTNIPVPWHPRIVSASLIMLGGLAVIGVPGEPTTMSGRRMRDVVGAVMENYGVEPRVVVTGLTNEYIHYIATFEEYQVQRYEAASTIYGPHTLEVFLNKFSELATAIFEGTEVPEGPEPQDHLNNTISFILPVVTDNAGLLQSFGDVLVQPDPVVRRGDTVSVTFIGANPRNNLKQEETHFIVERQLLGEWELVATDADWETKFIWERRSTLLGTSSVTIEWTVPEDAFITTYRFTYYGTARGLLGSMTDFTGTSNTFAVNS